MPTPLPTRSTGARRGIRGPHGTRIPFTRPMPTAPPPRRWTRRSSAVRASVWTWPRDLHQRLEPRQVVGNSVASASLPGIDSRSCLGQAPILGLVDCDDDRVLVPRRSEREGLDVLRASAARRRRTSFAARSISPAAVVQEDSDRPSCPTGVAPPTMISACPFPRSTVPRSQRPPRHTAAPRVFAMGPCEARTPRLVT